MVGSLTHLRSDARKSAEVAAFVALMIGLPIVVQAIDRGRALGARVAQCAIRVGNLEREGFFKTAGFLPSVTVKNAGTGNEVTVYQNVIVA